MQRALHLAQCAASLGEVPVGCVVAGPEGIIAQAHNLVETQHDPTAHAEILALRAAAQQRNSPRLDDCLVVVTLEPCPMCASALAHARVAGLIYATPDPKTGACTSLLSIPNDARFPRTYPFLQGLRQQEAAALLNSFFASLRS